MLAEFSSFKILTSRFCIVLRIVATPARQTFLGRTAKLRRPTTEHLTSCLDLHPGWRSYREVLCPLVTTRLTFLRFLTFILL